MEDSVAVDFYSFMLYKRVTNKTKQASKWDKKKAVLCLDEQKTRCTTEQFNAHKFESTDYTLTLQ